MTNYFNFKAFATYTELRIDDEIGGAGITAKDMVQKIKNCHGEIRIYINSGGGSVKDGIAIYNALQAHTGNVIVNIDAMAASMASMIAMAGDTVQMSSNGLLMIHNPWGTSVGDYREHEKTADVLLLMRDSILTAYEKKTGLAHAELIQMMDDETWLKGQSALELGFIDALTPETDEQQVSAKYNQAIQAKQDSLAQGLNAQPQFKPPKINQAKRAKAPSFHSAYSTSKNYTGINHVKY